MSLMPEKQEKQWLHAEYWRETFFLPPLKMVLTFLEHGAKEDEKKDVRNQEKATEKDLEKLIEKLSEKEE
jgi:hypothetical protein